MYIPLKNITSQILEDLGQNKDNRQKPSLLFSLLPASQFFKEITHGN